MAGGQVKVDVFRLAVDAPYRKAQQNRMSFVADVYGTDHLFVLLKQECERLRKRYCTIRSVIGAVSVMGHVLPDARYPLSMNLRVFVVQILVKLGEC